MKNSSSADETVMYTDSGSNHRSNPSRRSLLFRMPPGFFRERIAPLFPHVDFRNLRPTDLMEWFAPLPKRPQMGHDVNVIQTSKQKRGEP